VHSTNRVPHGAAPAAARGGTPPRREPLAGAPAAPHRAAGVPGRLRL